MGSFFSNQPDHFSLWHQAEERGMFLEGGEWAQGSKVTTDNLHNNEWWREVGKGGQEVTNDSPNWFILNSYSAQMPNHKILTSAYNLSYGHLISWVIFILTGPIINGIYEFLFIIISEQGIGKWKTKSFS